MPSGTRPGGTTPLGVPSGVVPAIGQLQFSTDLRNDLLDCIETHGGTAPILRIYTGARPDFLSDPSTGTLIVAITLPSDWMAAAVGAVKDLAGVWANTAAATGDVTTTGYFRLFESTGTTPFMQGSVGGTGSGKHIELDDPTITSGQTVTISTFTLTGGNG